MMGGTATAPDLGSVQVLSPGQVAQVLGVDPSTVRRWVRDGAVPNVFADLPTDRLGIPTWWVAERISPPAPGVVAGQQNAAGPRGGVRRPGQLVSLPAPAGDELAVPETDHRPGTRPRGRGVTG